MKKLIVSDIAKNGVQEAKVVQYQVDDTTKKLIREANERIKAEQNNCVNTYREATSYFVR
jgi:hypothetical protein